jgi:hypothetical protein
MALMASYAIDAGDRIVWTDQGFAGLAAEHGLAELAEDAVGRPLIEFVAGERPRALQRALIARARATPAKDPLELRYRCDSPAMRRFAVLQMAGQPDGGVVFTTWFEATEDRPYQPLLDRRAEHGPDTVELCAWCNRVKTSDGWHEVEDLPPSAQTDGCAPAVADGLCEICELLLTTRALTRPGAGPTRSGPYGLP